MRMEKHTMLLPKYMEPKLDDASSYYYVCYCVWPELMQQRAFNTVAHCIYLTKSTIKNSVIPVIVCSNKNTC